jgi:hypothetical protein
MRPSADVRGVMLLEKRLAPASPDRRCSSVEIDAMAA